MSEFRLDEVKARLGTLQPGSWIAEDLAAAVEEIERLRAALERYAWHATPLGTPTCPAQLVDENGPCTCGYEAAMHDAGLDPDGTDA